MTTHRKTALTLTTLALTAGLGTVNLDTAAAAGSLPLDGELCTARENIYMTTTPSTKYTVPAGDYIRISTGAAYDDDIAVGHSPNHPSGVFRWRHSDGVSRLRDCH